MTTCDVIVIGAGGVGTAAVGEVARRGARAIAIDRFAPGHDQGSSHGQTRIIRQAYFEHPDYVPLLLEAYRLWHRLEDRRGQRLLDPVGLIEIGPADGAVVAGVLASAAAPPARPSSNSPPAEIERRFPGLRVPEPLVGVFERWRGLFARRAGRHRPSGRSRTPRSQIAPGRERARLASPRRRRRGANRPRAVRRRASDRLCRRLGRAAVGRLENSATGAPQSGLLVRAANRGLSIRPRHADVLVRLARRGRLQRNLARCFYGFPQIDAWGVKVAEHSGGTVVDDPSHVDRQLDPAERSSA